jgi:hypothetical protein
LPLKICFKGKIDKRVEVMGRRGRRRKLLLDDLEETGGYRKRRHQIALCGELALEEAMDLS